MQTYKIDRASVEMAEVANRLRIMANAADGYHARQNGGTYGAAHEATILALACGIAEQSKVHFPEAREVAVRIQYECVDNGEDVTYQIENVFTADDHYGLGYTIELIDPELELVDRVTGRPATVYTPPEDRVTRAAWKHRMDAVLEEEYGGYVSTPTAGEGCGS